ncbi:MAG: MFS transporter [Bacteroidetes bacterium]|nr:MFS transporter [Bacteroidota bacterium]
MANRPRRSFGTLTVLVLAQFMGTSLWFAGNAAAPELESLLGKTGLVPWITSAVQLGFILGTFGYAFFQIADRFSPSKVFLWSALAAALANLSLLFFPLELELLLGGRFLTGIFLGGIYPVGMKIAADYVKEGLGLALGFLVGALVLGTAFPFLLQAMDWNLSYQLLFIVPSGLALVAGGMVGFGIPDGPFRRQSSGLNLRLIPHLASNLKLQGAAGGYFGHMWEVYTFWAFLPLLISYLTKNSFSSANESIWTFAVIAIGGFSCALGGVISKKLGSEKVALGSLIGSGACGLLLLLLPEIPLVAVLPFLLVWGMLVTADSPQFSTLVAQSVSPEDRGTALTLVNGLGFGLTIVSIQITQFTAGFLSPNQFIGLLCLGPLVGVFLFFSSRGFSQKNPADQGI